MYDYLLKLEAYELTRRTSINWERLMQIRHLKDRMVRKCQRLSKASPAMKKATKGEPFGFQTIVAPSDFRLKEMEKWFREQQKRATGTSKPVVSRPEKPTVASSTRPPQQQPSSTKPQTLIRAPANSEKLKEQAKPRGVQGPPQQEQRSISLPNSKRERAPPPRTYSPAPLPIILVAQREDYGLEPSFVEFASIEEVERSPIPPEISGINTSRQDGSTSPDSNPDVTKADRPSLARQPSRIKKTSISELAKNVSWVDGQELDKQIARYAAAAKQAQSAGELQRSHHFFLLEFIIVAGTWNEVRKLYFEQLRGLHNLHEQVCEGLDQLRTETEHLQRVEESVRRQREMLKASFADFENKYSQFQGKGTARPLIASQQTNQVDQ